MNDIAGVVLSLCNFTTSFLLHFARLYMCIFCIEILDVIPKYT